MLVEMRSLSIAADQASTVAHEVEAMVSKTISVPGGSATRRSIVPRKGAAEPSVGNKSPLTNSTSCAMFQDLQLRLPLSSTTVSVSDAMQIAPELTSGKGK